MEFSSMTGDPKLNCTYSNLYGFLSRDFNPEPGGIARRTGKGLRGCFKLLSIVLSSGTEANVPQCAQARPNGVVQHEDAWTMASPVLCDR